MNLAEQKERAVTFLKNMEKDPALNGALITDDFVFEMMSHLPGFSPVRGKAGYLKVMPKMLGPMFPNGLNMKFHTVIAEGPHVAIQCESDTIAATGKHYQNRYHFYFLFKGDLIKEVREYGDSWHVKETLLSG